MNFPRYIKREARDRNWQISTLNLLAQQNIPVTFANAAGASVVPAAVPVQPPQDRSGSASSRPSTTPSRTNRNSTR